MICTNNIIGCKRNTCSRLLLHNAKYITIKAICSWLVYCGASIKKKIEFPNKIRRAAKNSEIVFAKGTT
jgi:hypothetical protein